MKCRQTVEQQTIHITHTHSPVSFFAFVLYPVGNLVRRRIHNKTHGIRLDTRSPITMHHSMRLQLITMPNRPTIPKPDHTTIDRTVAMVSVFNSFLFHIDN